MIPFREASYRSQVSRLRNLAEEVARRYPYRVKDLHFIQHGENATFRLETAREGDFLLRIHRSGYHSLPAIEEELRWLRNLSKRILCPIPVVSKSNRWVETVEVPAIGEPRNCVLLRWVDGRFIRKRVSAERMFQIGELLAEFHTNSQIPIRHRNYWDADGLIGSRPRFGDIDHIQGASTQEQHLITRTRKEYLARLKAFHRKFPKRSGLIHADLHFGNLLVGGDQIAPIDFDDCGVGFFAHDLVIPILMLDYFIDIKKLKPSDALTLKDALFEGYSSKAPFDQHDEQLVEDMKIVRKLSMIGWNNSRSDNPRLKKMLRNRIKNFLKTLKKNESIDDSRKRTQPPSPLFC